MLSHMNSESAYPCPVCHTLTTLEHPCPGCGRAPDPNAAAVITLDARILDLRGRVDEAKRTFDGLTAELAEARRQRETYATAVRQSVAQERSSAAPTVPLTASPMQPVVIPATQAASRAEARPRTVQNLLFILGGIVLAIAAMIFTSVAWATFGV